jgi:thiamine-monophosphate kinase
MNELNLLRQILPTLQSGSTVVVGPGDDCAVIKFGNCYLLAACDQVVADVHYLSDATAPERVGAKLLKRNLSDIAAMGGTPCECLTTIATSRDDESWFLRFFAGLNAEAQKNHTGICGGDISFLPAGAQVKEVTTLTILGQVEPDKICLRGNAKPGDFLCATGYFGNSFKSGHHLNFTPRLAEGLFLAGKYTRAMIDVSDGLLLDASRVCGASQCGLQLFTDAILCRSGANLDAALHDGEDYELIFAVNPEKFAALQADWPFPQTPVTHIGVFNDQCGIITDRSGKIFTDIKGYEHKNN